MFLRRFRLKEFIKPHENASTYPELPSAYSVCSICPAKDEDTAEILAKIYQFGQTERKSFRNGMQKLLKIVNSGQRLEIHYDSKQCHETHSFYYNGSNHTIWRIRSNDLRILFYYGNDRVILLLDTFPKHRQSVTKAQKNAAEDVIKRYLDGKPITIIKDDSNETAKR
jgi:mRNA-degrading endonuclease RelE of RelBE toxin-antitoxin system